VSTLRSVPVFFSLLLVTAAGAAPQVSHGTVDLRAADGTVLKGTYFSSGKPGPGVLLLHQCNQQRKLCAGDKRPYARLSRFRRERRHSARQADARGGDQNPN
jgi:hypothetical protein